MITDRKGNPEPDPSCATTRTSRCLPCRSRSSEDPTERFATLEYRTAVDDYMRDEVLPYVPDAWVDHDKTKIGYEIPLTRHFYKYVPPRPLEEIDAEIKSAGGRDSAAVGRGGGVSIPNSIAFAIDLAPDARWHTICAPT